MFLLILFIQSAFALTNSVPELDTYYNNVTIIQPIGLDEHGDKVAGFCGATFLSPTILATAAHCIHHTQVLKINEVGIQSAHYNYVKNIHTGAVTRVFRLYESKKVKAVFHFSPAVLQKITRQGFKAQIAVNEDFALIELKENFVPPYEVTFAKLLPKNLMQEVLKNPSAYQPKVVTINFQQEMTSMDVRRSAILNSIYYSSGGLKSNSSSRVEPIDSGSPLFITLKGEKYLLGVVKGSVKRSLSSLLGSKKPDLYSIADLQR